MSRIVLPQTRYVYSRLRLPVHTSACCIVLLPLRVNLVCYLLQAYMEEHVRNADKLSDEWAALEKYVPDDCDIEAGKLNPELNRYPTILPCKPIYCYTE